MNRLQLMSYPLSEFEAKNAWLGSSRVSLSFARSDLVTINIEFIW